MFRVQYRVSQGMSTAWRARAHGQLLLKGCGQRQHLWSTLARRGLPDKRTLLPQVTAGTPWTGHPALGGGQGPWACEDPHVQPGALLTLGGFSGPC